MWPGAAVRRPFEKVRTAVFARSISIRPVELPVDRAGNFDEPGGMWREAHFFICLCLLVLSGCKQYLQPDEHKVRDALKEMLWEQNNPGTPIPRNLGREYKFSVLAKWYFT